MGCWVPNSDFRRRDLESCLRSTVGRVIEAGAFQDDFPCPSSVGG
jgi:hypothetical protein